ncbi:MAG: ABC transporter substrate-binding protein [Rubricoccaceae bacterium]|nr:ABC transporter substrate-binding protein [Rubricoccaceae bacterium]
MERRRFLTTAAAAGTAALAGCGGGEAEGGAPAVQTDRRVRWRLASSFPRSAEIIYRGAEALAERVAALTGGRFEIRPSPAGEIVPALQVLDAVQNRSVPIGHTAGYYFRGKSPALAFETAVPFGMTARQQNAWMLYGDGLDQTRRVLADFGVLNFLGGNTGTQMGGWFRRPVGALADLRGLKIRIPGLGGEVMDRLGALPQTIAGGEVYQALERGVVDAAEWIGPYDDERLGFQNVVQTYHYPGWWEPGAVLSFYVNQAEYDRLPEAYKEALAVASQEANARMLAEYDAQNPPALRRLVEGGVRLVPFPDDVMRAARDAARDLLEEGADPGGYRALLDAYRRFQTDSDRWLATAEQAYNQFTYGLGATAGATAS